MAEPLLRVAGVCKRFGGLLALDNASFIAETGRITALIGPNGAGKTTLFAIIAGFSPPSRGRIFYAGADITGEPPYLLARRGIARTFQTAQPFAGLSVQDNIAVGSYLKHPARNDARAAAGEIAREVGLGDHLRRPAASLTVSALKRLELARARMARMSGTMSRISDGLSPASTSSSRRRRGLIASARASSSRLSAETVRLAAGLPR